LIVFNNNQDFFEKNNTFFSETVSEVDWTPIEEFNFKDLHYWFKKEELDLTEFVASGNIISSSEGFINKILGYKIVTDEPVQVLRKNKIIDVIEYLLVKNGFNQKFLKKYREAREDLESYLYNLSEYLSKQDDTEYIKQCLLLIYDYDDFDKELNYDKESLNKINNLKNQYLERVKREKISSAILKRVERHYDQDYFFRDFVYEPTYSDNVPYYEQTEYSYDLEIENINSEFYKIENGKIFIREIFPCYLGFYSFEKYLKKENVWYKAYLKLYEIIHGNDRTLWKDVDYFLHNNAKEISKKIPRLNSVTKRRQIDEKSLFGLIESENYKIIDGFYKNNDFIANKSVVLIDEIFQRLNIGFDLSIKVPNFNIKTNFPYVHTSQKILDRIIFKKDELLILKHNRLSEDDINNFIQSKIGEERNLFCDSHCEKPDRRRNLFCDNHCEKPDKRRSLFYESDEETNFRRPQKREKS